MQHRQRFGEPRSRELKSVQSAATAVVVEARARQLGKENSHAVILLVAWLLGFVGIYTVGSFIHVLLVVAIVLFVVGLLNGRRVLG
jgi:uncharacterized membrane protein YtjA (UPF0391 family)